jgi:alpha-mannosidase
MEEFPEYKFGASQIVQYQWVRENYPQLWTQIKSMVKKGQWILLGGTWVEMVSIKFNQYQSLSINMNLTLE